MSSPRCKPFLSSGPSPVKDYPGELFRPQASHCAATAESGSNFAATSAVGVHCGLSGMRCPLPSRPCRDNAATIELLLMNLCDREEEHFGELLNQHKQLQKQISEMHLATKAAIDSQVRLRQRQEAVMDKLNECSPKSQLEDMEALAIENEEALNAIFHEIGSKAHARTPKQPQEADTADNFIGNHGLLAVPEEETYDLVDTTADITKENGNHVRIDVASDTTKENISRGNTKETTRDAEDTYTSYRSNTKELIMHISEATSDPVPSHISDTMDLDPSVRRQSRMFSGTKSLGLYEDDDTGCRATLSRFLQSKGFEFAIALAIMANGIIMCFEGQYHGLDVGFNLEYPGRKTKANDVWDHAVDVFNGLDWFFGIVFLIEFITKLVCWQHKYFWISRLSSKRKRINGVGLQGWNMLDLLCVVVFLLDKMVTVGAVNPQTLRLLRLFRLVRLVRLLRYLEQLDHLYVMTMALSGLKEVLAWAVVLLTTMLMTCDLLLVQTLHATYFDQIKASDLTEDQLQRYHKMYKYFGTCTRCMISMYEVTLGDWTPVARLLSEEASEWFALFCLAQKLTIGFAVIGVITGVILQETFKVAQTDDIILLRQKRLQNLVMKRKMETLFDELDENGDGKIETFEIEKIAENEELQAWLGSLGFESDDLITLFKLCDIDQDGYISVDEMVQRMPRIQGTARSMDVLAIRGQLKENLTRNASRPPMGHVSSKKFQVATSLNLPGC